MARIWIAIDVKTGEELAYHIENGKTFKRWVKELKDQGRDIEVRVEEKDK